MCVDRLLNQTQPHPRIAEIRQRRGDTRLERDRLLLAFAGIGVALQVEQRRAEISDSASADRGSTLTARARVPFGFFELPALQCGNAKQMQCIKMVRQVFENLLAQRLGVRMLALAIGSNGRRQQDLGPLL